MCPCGNESWGDRNIEDSELHLNIIFLTLFFLVLLEVLNWYIYIYIYIYMCVCVCVYIYIYIYIYI